MDYVTKPSAAHTVEWSLLLILFLVLLPDSLAHVVKVLEGRVTGE